jgi:hypothetical protein
MSHPRCGLTQVLGVMERVSQAALGILLFVASSLAHASGDPGKQVVLKLYQDFAWEAVLSSTEALGLADQPEKVLLRYFTPELASALVTDSVCKKRTREVCKLDFMPLWGSQDPAAQDLAISSGGNGVVQMEYVYPATGTRVVLKFQITSSKVGWRIADITYQSGQTLAQLLSQSAK